MNILVLLIVIFIVIGEFLFRGRFYDLKRRSISTDAMGIIFDKIFKIDNRTKMYAILSLPMSAIVILELLKISCDGISNDTLIKLILSLSMIGINFLLAMLSRHIIGIEETSIKVKDLVKVLGLYLAFNLYNSFFIDDELLQLKSLVIIPLAYFFLKEAMFAYIFIWFNNYFGKEKVYENEKIQIMRIYGNVVERYKIYLKEVDKTFALSEEVIKEHKDKLQGNIFEGSVKVKYSLICKRMIISEIW